METTEQHQVHSQNSNVPENLARTNNEQECRGYCQDVGHLEPLYPYSCTNTTHIQCGFEWHDRKLTHIHCPKCNAPARILLLISELHQCAERQDGYSGNQENVQNVYERLSPEEEVISDDSSKGYVECSDDFLCECPIPSESEQRIYGKPGSNASADADTDNFPEEARLQEKYSKYANRPECLQEENKQKIQKTKLVATHPEGHQIPEESSCEEDFDENFRRIEEYTYAREISNHRIKTYIKTPLRKNYQGEARTKLRRRRTRCSVM